ncbi:MAG TPA: PAS domain-containing protein [Cytophagaceae bacterium]|jgi:hypothetical protein|nr:PAS domain-containing protein [Cytophagaceae bacterium]
MIKLLVNKDVFKFKYLPDYADYILKNKLTEFVTIGIRFCREVDLPLLKPLSRFSEEELVAISLGSNRELLLAISKNQVSQLIEDNIHKWESNTITAIDKEDVVAEDLTLGFFLRRKIFAYFLDSYTKNVVEQKFIINEIDIYTTQEELIAYNIYIKTQQEKLALANKDLNFHKELLLEAQELGGIGSFVLNFKDHSKSVFTPEYQKILEIEGHADFDDFMNNVHPEDRSLLVASINNAYMNGGKYEVTYRYKKSEEKKIWSKGFILTENRQPVLIRGIVRLI